MIEDSHLALKDAVADDAETKARARVAVLNRHIRDDAIIYRLKASSRNAIIHEMIHHLHTIGAVKDPKRVEEEVLHREQIMSTGVGCGVACPHTRTAAVDKLVCAVGVTETPVDFAEDEEGKNCRIVILTLTPDAPGSPYMTFITAVLTALRSERRREAILEATTAAAIKKALIAP
jgi:mannitol/fructose-specific phosphotransferase system IIA component (Ntr-type)